MQIILIRHGDAENRASSDAARALTEKGRRQAQAAGEFLHAHHFAPTWFFSSPYRRAQETIAEINRHFAGEIREDARLACGAAPTDILAIINETARSGDDVFLIVGHNPDCAGIVEFFTGAIVDFEKSAIAILKVWELREYGAALAAFIPPQLCV